MASHRVSGRRLSRYKDQRKALMRGLVTALITHERITTTLAKAKETRIVAEKLITHGKKGNPAPPAAGAGPGAQQEGRGKGVRRHRPPVRRQARRVYPYRQARAALGRRRPPMAVIELV